MREGSLCGRRRSKAQYRESRHHPRRPNWCGKALSTGQTGSSQASKGVPARGQAGTVRRKPKGRRPDAAKAGDLLSADAKGGAAKKTREGPRRASYQGASSMFNFSSIGGFLA